MIAKKLEGRVITDGLRFPEGPIACADGSVLVVEIESGRLVRVAPDGTKTVAAELGGGPNGAAMGPGNTVYVCNNGGFNWITEADGYLRPHGRADGYTGGSIQRVDLGTGKVEVLYDNCNGVPLFGPNDIVFDGKGGFWFTDHGKSHDRIMDRGALYYAAEDGSFITEAAFPLITANGVGLSPDGRQVYATETETGRLWAWDIIGPGQLAKAPWPSPAGGRMIGGPQGYQRFDSLAVEEGGNICVASLVFGGISVFAADGSGLVEWYEGPEPYCTNICFGGPDRKTAYVTVSGKGLLLAVDWPRPGLTLAY
jgi:gluconolactonase